MATPKSAGAIYASIALEIQDFVSGLQTAAKNFTTFSNTVVQKAQTITKALSSMFGFFGKIFNVLTSLKTIVLGSLGAIFAYQFASRAAQVESITTAFVNLNRSMGALATDTLPRLRKATKGTIGDFELMQAVNNAILLGVSKNVEEFEWLGVAARRLGKAVGRDTISAFQDLSYGIGRQSRLILDNLGLVVRVGDAMEVYAKKVGKPVDKLTLLEQKMAFNQAAFQAIRDRIAQLGPDVDDLADAFGRFQATYSNFLTDLQRGAAPLLTRVFNLVTEIFTASRPVFQQISMFLGRAGDQVAKLFEDFSRGTIKNPFGTLTAFKDEIIPAIFRSLKNSFLAFLELAADMIMAVVDEIFGGLWIQLKRFVAEIRIALYGLPLFGSRSEVEAGKADRENLAKEFAEWQKTNLFGKFGGALSEYGGRLKSIFIDMGKAYDRFFSKVTGTEGRLTQTFVNIANLWKKMWENFYKPEGEPLREIQAMVYELTKGDFLKSGFTKIRNTLFGTGTNEEVDAVFENLRKMNEELEKTVSTNNLEEYAKMLRQIRIEIDNLDATGHKDFSQLLPFPFPPGFFRQGMTHDQVKNLNQQISILVARISELAQGKVQQAIKTTQEQLEDLGKTDLQKFVAQWERWLNGLLKEGYLTEEQTKSIRELLKELYKLQEGYLEAQEAAQAYQQALSKLNATIEKGKELEAEEPGDTAAIRQMRETERQIEELVKAGKQYEFGDVIAGARWASAENVRKEIEDEIKKVEDAIYELNTDKIEASIKKWDEWLVKVKETVPAFMQAIIPFDYFVERIKKLLRDQDETIKRVERMKDLANSLQSIRDKIKGAAYDYEPIGTLEKLREAKAEAVKAGWDPEHSLKEFSLIYQNLKATKDLIQTDLSKSFEDYRQTVQDHGKTDLEILKDQWQKVIDFMDKAGLTDQANALRARLKEEIGQTPDDEKVREYTDSIAEDLTEGFAGGIINGLREGMKWSEIWAKVTGNLFTKYLNQALEKVEEKLGDALAKLFANAAGMAGVATALIGIGSAIYSSLQGKGETMLDDVKSAVEQTEAVRGIVAGPTDVPIARVGNALKEALRVTEVLLERIATAIERLSLGAAGEIPGAAYNGSTSLSM